MEAAGEEDRVEHGGAEALKVVVCLDRPGEVFAVFGALGEDFAAAGGDDEGDGAGGFEGFVHDVEGGEVETISNDYGNATGLDGGLLWGKVELGEAGGGLAVVGASWGIWNGGADLLSDNLSQLVINVAETLTHAFVDDWVVAMVELECECVLDVVFLGWGKGVVKELGLVVVFLELGAVHADLDTGHLLLVIDEASL